MKQTHLYISKECYSNINKHIEQPGVGGDIKRIRVAFSDDSIIDNVPPCGLSRTERVQVHVYAGNNESEDDLRYSSSAIVVGF